MTARNAVSAGHGGSAPRWCGGFYSKFLGKTLRQAAEDFLSRPHVEQVALYEEVALSRALCGETLKVCAAALDPPDGVVIDAATRSAAVELAMEALGRVSKLVERASRVEALAVDRVSLKAVDMFIVQVVKVVQEVLGTSADGIARAAEVERLVRERVRAPLDRAHLLGEQEGAAPRVGVRVVLQASPPSGGGEG